MNFEKECGIELQRENGGWTKFITGIDETQRGGYSLLGNFVKSNKDISLKEGLYVDCDKFDDYRKNVFRLFELQDNKLELLSEIKGSKWTDEFHRIIREKQGMTIDEGMNDIENIIKQFTVADQEKIKAALLKKYAPCLGAMFTELDFIADELLEYEKKNKKSKGKWFEHSTTVGEAVAKIFYYHFKEQWNLQDKNVKMTYRSFGVTERKFLQDYRFHSYNKYGEFFIGTGENDDGEFVIRVGHVC